MEKKKKSTELALKYPLLKLNPKLCPLQACIFQLVAFIEMTQHMEDTAKKWRQKERETKVRIKP